MVLLVSMMASKAQEPLSFDFVIAKDGVTAEQIYTQLIDWIATDFKSVDGDFYRDKEERIITKDVVFSFSTKKLTMICYDGKISYKLKFQCRDGRFKMELTNFNHSVNPGNNQGCALGLILAEAPEPRGLGNVDDKAWLKIKDACEEEANRIKGLLEAKNFDAKNDDW